PGSRQRWARSSCRIREDERDRRRTLRPGCAPQGEQRGKRMWMRRPGRGAWLGFVLAAGAAACGGGENQGGPAGGGGGRPMGERAVPVATAAVETGTIARSITVSGVVTPLRAVGINSQLPGAVREVRVQEGDVVRAGAVLARLDDRELRAQVASAEAAFEVAE